MVCHRKWRKQLLILAVFPGGHTSKWWNLHLKFPGFLTFQCKEHVDLRAHDGWCMVSCGGTNHLADPCPHGRDLSCRVKEMRHVWLTILWCLDMLSLWYLTIGCGLHSLSYFAAFSFVKPYLLYCYDCTVFCKLFFLRIMVANILDATWLIGSHVWQPAVGTIPCQNRAARNSSSFWFLSLTARDEGWWCLDRDPPLIFCDWGAYVIWLFKGMKQAGRFQHAKIWTCQQLLPPKNAHFQVKTMASSCFRWGAGPSKRGFLKRSKRRPCPSIRHEKLGGGFNYFLFFTPIPWGKKNIKFWRSYFSKGLVQPPSR